MDDRSLEILKKNLASEKAVAFAYLFGSRAKGDAGKSSDIDIAVYLKAGTDDFQYRLKLAEQIAKDIGKQEVDLVVLNRATPLLRHQIVKTGVVVKESREDRVDFETRCLQEYLDTRHLRDTQLSYLRKQIREGTFFG
mgnify:CR=1 FL=1